MAHIYSKGWFVQQLKAANISKIDGRKLESYKTYILRNLHAELIEQGKINGQKRLRHNEMNPI
ncbi:hypothetical protein PMEGAS228_19680 [Priestia megaterium]